VDAELRAQIARRERVIEELKRILIENLHVAVPADAIDLDAALFGTGLGLDSVDALELVIATEASFRVTFPQETLRGSLRTVNAVVDRVLGLEPSKDAA
jgi:acyl carrier protein